MSRIVGLVEGSVELTADTATCRVCFAPSEPVFQGHFPGDPIVPGVLMLEGLIALNTRLGSSVSGVKEAKFRALARPNDALVYTMTKEGVGSVAQMGGEVVLSCKLSVGIRNI